MSRVYQSPTLQIGQLSPTLNRNSELEAIRNLVFENRPISLPLNKIVTISGSGIKTQVLNYHGNNTSTPNQVYVKVNDVWYGLSDGRTYNITDTSFRDTNGRLHDTFSTPTPIHTTPISSKPIVINNPIQPPQNNTGLFLQNQDIYSITVPARPPIYFCRNKNGNTYVTTELNNNGETERQDAEEILRDAGVEYKIISGQNRSLVNLRITLSGGYQLGLHDPTDPLIPRTEEILWHPIVNQFNLERGANGVFHEAGDTTRKYHLISASGIVLRESTIDLKAGKEIKPARVYFNNRWMNSTEALQIFDVERPKSAQTIRTILRHNSNLLTQRNAELEIERNRRIQEISDALDRIAMAERQQDVIRRAIRINITAKNGNLPGFETQRITRIYRFNPNPTLTTREEEGTGYIKLSSGLNIFSGGTYSFEENDRDKIKAETNNAIYLIYDEHGNETPVIFTLNP